MSTETTATPAQGDAVLVGSIVLPPDGRGEKSWRIPFGLLVEFDDPESLRQAIREGVVRFTVFGQEAITNGDNP